MLNLILIYKMSSEKKFLNHFYDWIKDWYEVDMYRSADAWVSTQEEYDSYRTFDEWWEQKDLKEISDLIKIYETYLYYKSKNRWLGDDNILWNRLFHIIRSDMRKT